MVMKESEQVVFVDKDGRPTGETGPKLASHTANTRLHLAFSCYILRKSDNKLLVTQRALSKKVWPGVWTNSVCGHLAPNESMEDAIRRRASYELGLTKLDDLACLVPDFIYRTPPHKGIVDHEFCPVFVAYTEEEPKPNPEEVETHKWMDWPAYVDMLKADKGDNTSYWAKVQYEHLKDLEPFRSLAIPNL